MQSTINLIIMATALLITGTGVTAQSPGKKALLVVDVQENLLDPNSGMHMDPAAIPPFIENLNKSIEFFAENKMPVIYIVNEFTNPFLNLLTSNACKKGAKGTDIDKRVNRVNDLVYRKSKSNALTNRDLSQYLKENAISELYVTGLFAEYCIKATAISAKANNYKVIIIEDAVGSKSAAKKSKAVGHCKSKGVSIITSDQLLQGINARSIHTIK